MLKTPQHQARIDGIMAAARAEVPPDAARRALFREAPLVSLRPSEDLLDLRLQEEVDYARRLLENVGDRLASDPIVLARHMTTLQSFDILGQMLGHIAKIIGSSDRAEAVERVGMSDLRARLMRPSRSITETGSTNGLQRSSANPFSTN